MQGFFKVQSVLEVQAHFLAFPQLAVEEVSLLEAHGRVLARAVAAAEDLPLCHRSTMDGYAVQARDTFGASAQNPAYLELAADYRIEELPGTPLAAGHCAGIVTGGCLPPQADAVVMVEQTSDMDGTIEVRKAVAPFENVMEKGEDVAEGVTALEAGSLVRPQELGLAAALGHETLTVGARPRVAVISTGDELIEPREPVRPGLIRDVNSSAVTAMAVEAGSRAVALGIVRDTREALEAAVTGALAEHDVVLVSGGSSVGARDHTLAVAEALPGAEVLCHGVAVRPGKPLILVRAGGKAVIGLPGHVASAQVVMRVLVMPFLRHLQGMAAPYEALWAQALSAELAKNAPSVQGRDDYVRVRLTPREGRLPLAEPVTGKSGLLRTLLRAQGLMRIPAEAEGLEAGELVAVLPL